MSDSPLGIGVPERQMAMHQPIRTLLAPDELQIEPCAWRALATGAADALIVGGGGAVSRVLTFIWPTLRKPVFWCQSRRLLLPAHCPSTLVLEDADALEADDQRRLLEWLSGGAESPRLIATASPRLLPLVEDGKFSRTLYQRFTAVQLVARS